MNKRMIVKIGGVFLCVLFFAAPLAQCSQDSDISATGIEIATGTGKLMEQADTSYPLVFALLIIPIILVILVFSNNSFVSLRNTSIAGLSAQIIFMLAAYTMLNSQKGEAAMFNGAFELTAYNMLILGIYIGLICFTHYCIKEKNEGKSTSTTAFKATHKVKPLTDVPGIGLRKEPYAYTKPFDSLLRETEVELIELGEKASLNGTPGCWFKIRTVDLKTGWCFSGSLEEIKSS